MQTLQSGLKGLTLLVRLNADRALYTIALIAALAAGGWALTP